MHVARHQRDDGAGVDAAGQEGAPGHVGAQPDAGRVVEDRQEFLGPGVETRGPARAASARFHQRCVCTPLRVNLIQVPGITWRMPCQMVQGAGM